MTPATINTILNSAPMVIQGAGKLIALIREQTHNQQEDKQQDQPTLESLDRDIGRLETRLGAVDDSNIEQIKLIEELAKQNETLAASLARMNTRLNQAVVVAGLALLLALGLLLFVFLP